MAPYIRSLDHICRLSHQILTSVLASVVIIILVTGASLGLGLYAMFGVKPSPVIDLSIKAFGIPNHIVSQRQDAFDQAVKEYAHDVTTGHVRRRSIESEIAINPSEFSKLDLYGMSVDGIHREKRNSGGAATQYQRWEVVYLVYLAQNGDNIFTLDRVATIRQLEMDIVHLPQFSDFCYIVQNQCAPLRSLIPFIYSESTESQEALDGAVREALSTSFGVFFTDGHVNATYHKSKFLRSEIHFGCPLAGMYSETFNIF
jgi:hypothetical protein